MKLVAVVVGLFAAATEANVVSTGLTLSGTEKCGGLNTGVCKALKEDLPTVSLYMDKFTSLSERSLACARSFGIGCDCTLEGTIRVETDSICSDVAGYQIPDHILRNGWVIDPKILVNKDLSSCSPKARYAQSNMDLCSKPELGTEVTITPATDSIILDSGNPTAELALPCSMTTDGMVFTLNVKHTASYGEAFIARRLAILVSSCLLAFAF